MESTTQRLEQTPDENALAELFKELQKLREQSQRATEECRKNEDYELPPWIYTKALREAKIKLLGYYDSDDYQWNTADFCLWVGLAVIANCLHLRHIHLHQLTCIFALVVPFVGLYIADFITGCVHIYLDFLEASDMNRPHKLAFRFKIHHLMPALITQGDSVWDWSQIEPFFGFYVFGIWTMYLLRVLISVCVNQGWDDLTLGHTTIQRTFGETTYTLWDGGAYYGAICTVSWFGALVCQIPHAMSHGKFRSWWVAEWLRYLGVFQSIDAHLQHHTHVDRNFCLLNGWANGLLNVVYWFFLQPFLPKSTSPAEQVRWMKERVQHPFEDLMAVPVNFCYKEKHRSKSA